MSQALTEEGIMQWIKTLPKKKGETPEKPTAMQAAAGRLDVLGTPQQAYPPGSAAARADSVILKYPLASEVRAEKQKVRRQTRMDKQQRLREVNKEIRDITLLLSKRVIDDDGNVVFGVPMDPEDKIEIENQRAALKKERDDLTGKRSQSDDPEGLYP